MGFILEESISFFSVRLHIYVRCICVCIWRPEVILLVLPALFCKVRSLTGLEPVKKVG